MTRQKFSTLDREYLSERKLLSGKHGPRELWSIIDHWPLYCGVANLARFLAVADQLRRTLDVPGHVAEFGSWRGANLMLLAKLLRIFDPWGAKQVHCFDSFEGLSTFAPEDGQATEAAGTYQGSFDELQDLIGLYKMADEILIHRGDIRKELPKVLEASPELSFSFVYCDVDLYEPTDVILGSVHERLSVGGLFLLDEWNYAKFPGETVAVREFLESFGHLYDMEHVPHTRQPSLILRKVRIS